MVFPLMVRGPTVLLVAVTVPETMLLPTVTVVWFASTVMEPATRLAAHPAAGSPISTGTVAFRTITPAPGFLEGPEMVEPHTAKPAGASAVMPRLIWELTTDNAPPGLTVTGPATR